MATNILERYGRSFSGARLTPLRHEQNATFRVDTDGARHVLRISRSGLHTPATIASEMAWLVALRNDARLRVPEPIPARDRSVVVTVGDGLIPGEHPAVLMRWLDGRLMGAGVTSAHLARIGSLLGDLEDHASTWRPPPDFVRPRVDTLTTAGKRATFSGPPPRTAPSGAVPSVDDGESAVALVTLLVSAEAGALVERAITRVRETTAALGAVPESSGLVHADLHPQNVLFHSGEAHPIDFDDCGWGFYLYDVAVPLSELTARPRYRELRAALVEAYASRRSLPDEADRHIDAFIALRGLQIIMWVLESREQPAFRHRWREWAREELHWLSGLLPA